MATAADTHHPCTAADTRHPCTAADTHHPCTAVKDRHPCTAVKDRHPCAAAKDRPAIREWVVADRAELVNGEGPSQNIRTGGRKSCQARLLINLGDGRMMVWVAPESLAKTPSSLTGKRKRI